jgi:hypothetical protein
LKKLLLAGVMTVALLTSAQATPLGLFDGPMKILTASSSCGYFAGSIFTAMYMPPNVGSNGSGSRLTVLMNVRDEQQASMALYQLATGSFKTSDGSAVTVDENNMGVGLAANSTAQITITQQVPKVPVDTTVSIKMAGSITGFSGKPDCTVGFDATVLNYPLP